MNHYNTGIFIDHNTLKEGSILITKEFLDSDDKLSNLGIFSEETEFYTLSEDMEITEYYKKTDEFALKLFEIRFT